MSIIKYLKNRWAYAVIAMFCSLTVMPLAGYLLGLKTNRASLDYTNYDLSQQLMFTGLPAACAALICWPAKTNRTSRRMFWAGILTVMLTFMLMPISMAIGNGTLSELDNVVERGLFMLTLGSLITYGLPYVIAVMVSLVFVDHY